MRFAALAPVPYATGEAMIVSAIAVAGDPATLAAAMNRQVRVSDPLAAARALPLSDPPTVTCAVQFDFQGGVWTLSGVRLGQRSNDSGPTAPQVSLANRAAFDALVLDASQSEALRAVRARASTRQRRQDNRV